MDHTRFKIKQLDVDTGSRYLAVVSPVAASELGVMSNERVRVRGSRKTITALVLVSKKIVKEGEVGLPVNVIAELEEEIGGEVEIYPAERPLSIEYIRKKMDGMELEASEIEQIIKDIVNRNLSDVELAAYVSSVYTRGMTIREIRNLTLAMVETGDVIEFDQEPVFDFHSIGGVPGNKVTLIIVPIVAAAGFFIPKTSSRAISSACGTADIFEVLCNVTFSIPEIKQIAERVGGLIAWGGGVNIAPADDLIIKAEYPLSIDPYPQLIASILAKKRACGVQRLVVDIPVGPNTKVESMELAKKYSRDIMLVGEELGMRVECAITYGAQPVGRAIGPLLEAKEALAALEGKKVANSVVEKSVSLAGMILEMGGVRAGTGRDKAMEILRSGRALEKMREIIEAQGGDPDVTSDTLEGGKYSEEIASDSNGYVVSINNKSLVKVARAAGAPVRKGAGILLEKKMGMKVDRGEIIYTIFSDSKTRLEEAVKLSNRLKPVAVEGMVLERVVPSGRIL
ncbi:MAG: AMP phosphorylase [Candidatus Syntrophoarchaeum sp. WYZ-LMO15]|nr:MAG: AMP phosphorylase [Candidatus Syntrophoarchaeum sp. WYZ-LMO15]